MINFICIFVFTINAWALSDLDPKKLRTKEAINYEENRNKAKGLYDNLEEIKISDDLVSGTYLIYDCENRFYSCVNDESFKKCETWRKEEYQNNRYQLKCAPLKNFGDYNLCKKALYREQGSISRKDFCINKKFIREFKKY